MSFRAFASSVQLDDCLDWRTRVATYQARACACSRALPAPVRQLRASRIPLGHTMYDADIQCPVPQGSGSANKRSRNRPTRAHFRPLVSECRHPPRSLLMRCRLLCCCSEAQAGTFVLLGSGYADVLADCPDALAPPAATAGGDRSRRRATHLSPPVRHLRSRIACARTASSACQAGRDVGVAGDKDAP